MDLSFTPAEEAFRAGIRTWLQTHLPPGWGSDEFQEPASLEEEVRFLIGWQRQLHAGGWVGVELPLPAEGTRRARGERGGELHSAGRAGASEGARAHRSDRRE